MHAGFDYFDKTLQLLQRIRERETENIDRAAAICTESIANGGLVFLFGNGHSRMMCEEMTPRQGAFVGFVALVELALSNHAAIVGANGLRAPLHLEKYEGYAEEILKGFHFGPHDAFVIISTSGIRPVVVEMATGAQRRGMPVIGSVKNHFVTIVGYRKLKSKTYYYVVDSGQKKNIYNPKFRGSSTDITKYLKKDYSSQKQNLICPEHLAGKNGDKPCYEKIICFKTIEGMDDLWKVVPWWVV